jgi:hypothetical protein
MLQTTPGQAISRVHVDRLMAIDRQPWHAENCVSVTALTLRVHQLGYFAPPQTTPVEDRPYVLPALLEDTPAYRTTLVVRDRVRTARGLNATTEVRLRGNGLEATVNDIHEVLLIQY